MILPPSGSTAWVRRSRPCLAEPPAEAAPTRPGDPPGLPRPPPRLGGPDALLDGPARGRRILFEGLRQFLVHDGLDQPLDVAVAQLGLGLALQLGVGGARRGGGGG